MEVFFRDIQLLCKFYGCGIFEKAKKETRSEHMFFVKSSDRPAQGMGFYDEQEGKFILMEGSFLAAEVVKSFKSIASRDLFINEHCKKDKGQIVLLHEFHLIAQVVRLALFLVVQAMDGMIGKMLKERS